METLSVRCGAISHWCQPGKEQPIAFTHIAMPIDGSIQCLTKYVVRSLWHFILCHNGTLHSSPYRVLRTARRSISDARADAITMGSLCCGGHAQPRKRLARLRRLPAQEEKRLMSTPSARRGKPSTQRHASPLGSLGGVPTRLLAPTHAYGAVAHTIRSTLRYGTVQPTGTKTSMAL